FVVAVGQSYGCAVQLVPSRFFVRVSFCPPLLFFLLLRRPATCTLFPYTTLFRSRVQSMSVRAFLAIECAGMARVDFFLRAMPAQDRKSTRLNSSHEWSSYAVFCLKKNKYTPAEPN